MISLKPSFIFLATVFVNVALSFPLNQRSVADIAADIQTVNSDLNTVTNDLNGLSNTGASGLDALDTDTAKLISDVQQTTSDATATGPIDETDAETLLEDLQPVGEALISLLNLFVTEKEVFEELSSDVPGLIQDTENGLIGFSQTVGDLTEALDSISPPDTVSMGNALQSAVASAFASAISAYSS